MKIDSAAAGVKPVGGLAQPGRMVDSGAGEAFRRTLAGLHLEGQALSQRIESAQRNLVATRYAQAGELLRLQFKVGQYGLGIELVSRIGEGASGMLRRLEQNH